MMVWCCTKTGTPGGDPGPGPDPTDCGGLANAAPAALQMTLSGMSIDPFLYFCGSPPPQISGIPYVPQSNPACPCVWIYDIGVDEPGGCYAFGNRFYFQIVEISGQVVWRCKLFVPVFRNPIEPCEAPPDSGDPTIQLSVWQTLGLGLPPADVLGPHRLDLVQTANPIDNRGDILHDPNSFIDIVAS